jgi:hypothetical protein
VVAVILEFFILRLRSRKFVLVEGSSITQEREPQLLMQVLKDSHVVSLLVAGGTQIPKMSSLK